MLQYAFEIAPVVLALWAMQLIGSTKTNDRVLGSIAFRLVAISVCLALVVAQTSWHAVVMAGGLEDTVWVNSIWTVFNTGVMICFIWIYRKRPLQ
jgi:uncharacterized membrane protein YidH (DUF202 family)